MKNLISRTAKTIKNWWLFLLTGIFMILGSVLVFTTPVESYLTLSWLFSLFVFVSGISHMVFSISNHKEISGWGWYLAGGIFEIAMGVVLILNPGISLAILPTVLGVWFMFRGAQFVAISMDMKKYGVLDWGWLMVLGIGISIMAFFMILDPVFGFFNIVYLTSFALLMLGISSISLSIKLKKIKTKVHDTIENVKGVFKNIKEELVKNIQEPTPEVK